MPQALESRRSSFDRALEWLHQSLSIFDLSPYEKGGTARLQLMKPIGEIVLTLGQLKRTSIRPAWAHTAVETFWDQLERGEELVNMLRLRPDLISLTTMCRWFAEFGLGSGRLDRLADHVLGLDFIPGMSVPEYRHLELQPPVCRRSNDDFRAPRRPLLLETSAEPWVIDEDMAYTITHEVFYITDFGRHAALRKKEIDYLRLWLPVWIAHYLDRENLDVAAELIMCANIVGDQKETEPFWETLIGRQSAAGFFPGPGPSELLRHADSSARAREALNNYHTTCVMLMALATSVAPRFVRGTPQHPFQVSASLPRAVEG